MVEKITLSALYDLKNVGNYDFTLWCCKIGSFLTLLLESLEYNADFNVKNSSGN